MGMFRNSSSLSKTALSIAFATLGFIAMVVFLVLCFVTPEMAKSYAFFAVAGFSIFASDLTLAIKAKVFGNITLYECSGKEESIPHLKAFKILNWVAIIFTLLSIIAFILGVIFLFIE